MGRFSPQHSERDCGSIASPSELLNRAKESPPGNAVSFFFFFGLCHSLHESWKFLWTPDVSADHNNHEAGGSD